MSKSLIAVITAEAPLEKLGPFLRDERFEVLSLDEVAKGRPIPVGLRYKLAFRYALESGFDRVFPVHIDEYFDPALLQKLVQAYDGGGYPEAVFGFRSARLEFHKHWGSRLLTLFQNWVLSVRMSEFLSRYHSYSTDLLSRIPFERNSDGDHFTTELAVQCLAANGRILQVPLSTSRGQGKRTISALGYLWGAARLILHLRLMRMGFLYDRRFDLGNWEYPSKPSKWSSHTQIEESVPAGSRVLDIGCGKGATAEKLVAKGCTVAGVDLLEPRDASLKLESYLQVDLNRNPESFFAWFKEQRFDCIVMGDIIEHLVDPERFLETLRNSLGKDHQPTLIISTGNVAFIIVRTMLMIGQFNYAPRGILDRTHTRLFTLNSFSRLFQQCGYEVMGRKWTPLPLSSLGGRFFAGLEAVSHRLAQAFPSVFAYQMIYVVRPLPTTFQLLHRHAEKDHLLNKPLSHEQNLETSP